MKRLNTVASIYLINIFTITNYKLVLLNRKFLNAGKLLVRKPLIMNLKGEIL